MIGYFLVLTLANSLNAIVPIDSVESSKTIFVSASGNDANPGTATKPVKTLAYAASLARSFQAPIIRVAAGTFPIASPVRLPPNTSLIGAGISRTIFTYTTVSDYAALNDTGPERTTHFAITCDNAQTAHYQGFALNGATGLTDTTRDRAYGGLYLKNLNSGVVSQVRFSNFDLGGLWISTPKDSEVENCEFLWCGHAAKAEDTASILFNAMTNTRIHHCQIRENRGAEGMRTYNPDWQPGRELGVNVNSHARIDHNVIHVRQQGGWGTGQPGAVIDFWNALSNDCEIDNNQVNENITVTGQTGPGKNYHIHHNNMVEDPGYSYAFELSVGGLELDHNHVVNGIYPFANFGGLLDRVSIHDNVVENVENVNVMNNGAGFTNSTFANNLIIMTKPLVFYQSNSGSPTGLKITKNIFCCTGAYNTLPLVQYGNKEDNGLTETLASDNLFVNMAPQGKTGKLGGKMLSDIFTAKSKKPYPYYTLLDGQYAGYGPSLFTVPSFIFHQP